MEPFLYADIILIHFLFDSTPHPYHGYPFLTLSLVGSYQVGYTRSHPNTEVKMLRACSVPLCSHRWERQVIYLLFFFIITITIITDTTMLILTMPYPYTCTRYTYSRCVPLLFFYFPDICFCFCFLTNLFICLSTHLYTERFHGVVGYHITFT